LDTDPRAIRDFVASSPATQTQLDYFKRYVPTRFLAPWFAANLRGLEDFQKGRKILELAKQSQAEASASLYWLEDESIRINNSWRAFLIENMAVVRAFAEQHFAKYLQ